MILSFQKKETDFLDMRRSCLSLAEVERSNAAIVFEPVEKPSPRHEGHSYSFLCPFWVIAPRRVGPLPGFALRFGYESIVFPSFFFVKSVI